MADFGTVARPYARALFELANANGELDKWSSALTAATAIVNDPLAKRSLARPDLARAAAHRSPAGRMPGSSGREGLGLAGGAQSACAFSSRTVASAAVPEIAAQFDELKAAAENKVKATLVSAVEVGQSDRRQGRESIAEEARAHRRAEARGGSRRFSAGRSSAPRTWSSTARCARAWSGSPRRLIS